MSEAPQSPIPPAPPGWTEAMQGKQDHTKRIAAGKKAFVVLFLIFFGAFLWLYILYNISHSKKTPAVEHAAVPHGGVPVASAPPMVGMPAAAPAPFMGSTAPAHFGAPRGMTSEQGMAPMPQTGFAPQPALQALPAQPAYMPMHGNPYAQASLPGGYATQPFANPYGAPQQPYAAPPSPYAPAGYHAPRLGDMTISAPREFRHAIGMPGGVPSPPASVAQRSRTVVNR
jgi:hypothetical protein